MWKAVEGFEGYEIASDGRLRSWVRPGPSQAPRQSPVIVKGVISPKGYLVYSLRRPDLKHQKRFAHRLVAHAFLGAAPNDRPFALHCDGNPANNSVENLRWGTAQENSDDKIRHGTYLRGDKCPYAKLTAEIVAHIRSEVANGPRGTQRRLSEKLGISPSQICTIVKGRSWAEHQLALPVCTISPVSRFPT